MWVAVITMATIISTRQPADRSAKNQISLMTAMMKSTIVRITQPTMIPPHIDAPCSAALSSRNAISHFDRSVSTVPRHA